jgi:hypothetical protein
MRGQVLVKNHVAHGPSSVKLFLTLTLPAHTTTPSHYFFPLTLSLTSQARQFFISSIQAGLPALTELPSSPTSHLSLSS